MSNEQLEDRLRRLVLGLADQAITRGSTFMYDGGQLHADDVADIALPSILCIAQSVSARTGLGDFGYQFSIEQPNPVFPLHATCVREGALFFDVAPFVSEVFHGEVLDCRQDLAVLFEAAAQLVRPAFNLASNTDYTVFVGSPIAEESVASSSPEQGLE